MSQVPPRRANGLSCGAATLVSPPLLHQVAPRYPRRVQRLIIAVGLAIAALGLLWPWLARLPLGRLPGDLMIERPGFRFYAPITTMILVSLALSVIVWLWRR